MARKNAERKVEEEEKRPPVEEEAPEEATKWWGRNPWFAKPEHAPESAYARMMDIQVENEGFDKNSSEYYEELDKRLQKRFPELYSKKKSKPPVSPSGGTGGSQKPRKDGRIRLTKQELQVARDLGITSEEALREYAKEIAAMRSS